MFFTDEWVMAFLIGADHLCHPKYISIKATLLSQSLTSSYQFIRIMRINCQSFLDMSYFRYNGIDTLIFKYKLNGVGCLRGNKLFIPQRRTDCLFHLFSKTFPKRELTKYLYISGSWINWENQMFWLARER